jgi:hypothetical protein
MSKQTEDQQIPKAVKVALIDQEIASYRNGLYQMTLRYRVQKKIGGTPEALKTIEDDMVKIESAIDELQDILEAVRAEA